MLGADGKAGGELCSKPVGSGENAGNEARRVLLLGSYAPSLIIFRGPLIAALVAKGHEVVAAAPAMDRATAEALAALGARPASADLVNSSLNPIGMWRSYRELRILLRSERPDVIISYTIKPVIVGAIAARAEGVPRVVSLISGLGLPFTDGGGIRRRLLRLIASLLYRVALSRSDLVLFQNSDDPALLRRLRVLPAETRSAIVDGSGVDLDHFSVAPQAGRPSFVMIARLLRDKGVREYAEAGIRLREQHPEASIGLVGYLDPSPNSLSQEELHQLISAGVEFHGKLDDVRPALSAASVYVLPSYYREGTPRSILEAMAVGRAIITADAPGCRETVIDGVNGFLVPPRSVDALYGAMKRFVDDPQLAARMGAESRKIAERRYDAGKVSADILRHVGL